MPKFFLLSLFLSLNSAVFSQKTEFFDAADAVFSEYVSEGKVDYRTLKNNPKLLENALKIAENSPINAENPAVYQAFWINAYNLAVIKGIVDHYPVASPLDVPGFFDEITYSLGGKQNTLNHIENDLLRAKFPDEARFHFALVCAGLGCPPIIDQAYRPEKLDKQLQKQTEVALNNPDFIRIKGENVQLSMIFKWYKEDFEKHGGAVVFINDFRKQKLPKNATLDYYEYNWMLNEAD